MEIISLEFVSQIRLSSSRICCRSGKECKAEARDFSKRKGEPHNEDVDASLDN